MSDMKSHGLFPSDITPYTLHQGVPEIPSTPPVKVPCPPRTLHPLKGIGTAYLFQPLHGENDFLDL